MFVFRHSEVGTGQNLIKLKLKIGTGSMTGASSRQQTLCADVAGVVIPRLGVQEIVLPSLM